MQIRDLGLCPYESILNKMMTFTTERTPETPDEIWLCEHPPVFTLGRNGDPAMRLYQSEIPLVKTDRGGQITYHGPGQLMVYFLIDLRRQKIAAAEFVKQIETQTLQFLQAWQINAHLREGMPGVYVNNAKIASLGLRIRNARSYHGLALNVEMDLSPFTQIHPCGYAHLQMTQICEFVKMPHLMENVISQWKQGLSCTHLM
jgi:lipoyl(octanoyl) transferase